MTKLKHDRPELRAKDDIRRELLKVASFVPPKGPDRSWPAFMHPVTGTPDALKALVAMIEAVTGWAEREDEGFTLDPPEAVVDTFKRFGRLRLNVSHSSGFTGADWLAEPVATRSATDFRPAYSIIFKALM